LGALAYDFPLGEAGAHVNSVPSTAMTCEVTLIITMGLYALQKIYLELKRTHDPSFKPLAL
jgi:hypothetical protein